MTIISCNLIESNITEISWGLNESICKLKYQKEGNELYAKDISCNLNESCLTKYRHELMNLLCKINIFTYCNYFKVSKKNYHNTNSH